MKMLLVVFLCICLALGCANRPSYKSIKKHFYNKFEGKNTGLDTLIDINGYYTMKNASYQKDTAYRFNLLFFDDGTFACQFSLEGLPQKEFEYNLDHKIAGTSTFRAEWGIYQIDNDIIKTQETSGGSLIVPYSASERWYKIIDKQTLKYVYGRALEDTIPYKTDKYSLAKFVLLDTLPSSNCWLKEDKYFWRCEADWKVYMERINKLKK